MTDQPAAGDDERRQSVWPGVCVLVGFLALVFAVTTLFGGWRFAVWMFGTCTVNLTLYCAVYEGFRIVARYDALVPVVALAVSGLALAGVFGIAALTGWAQR